LVASPIPAGVGNHLQIPSQLEYGTLNTTVFNAVYGPTPNASFSWNAAGNDLAESNLSGLSSLSANLTPYYQNGALFGLAITIHQTTEGFGIPIHLIKGGVEDVPGSFPAEMNPYGDLHVGYWDNNTYILPVSTDQGSWDVYVPGAGNETGPSGLLFVQTGVPAG
jgi:hypothetical protein